LDLGKKEPLTFIPIGGIAQKSSVHFLKPNTIAATSSRLLRSAMPTVRKASTKAAKLPSKPAKPSKVELGEWSALKKELSKTGLTPSYLRDVVLPSWWEPEVTTTRNGFLETVALIHRHTGLALPELMSGQGKWLPQPQTVRYKKSVNHTEVEVKVALQLVQKAAETAASAMDDSAKPWIQTFPTAAELHATLKARGSKDWVGLEDLITWCWENGILVLHVNNFPSKAKKPEGLAFRTASGRPVILLCKNTKKPAWQIFIVAHELGHLAEGHVEAGSMIVDAEVVSSEDADEVAANAFAIRLLTGTDQLKLDTQQEMYPKSLALYAKAVANSKQVSPGVVVMNWGFQSKQPKKWGTANGALGTLEGDTALDFIRDQLAKNLAWDELDGEASDWLQRMVG
jgi:hypothetical protein